jgi:hypothetical protein
MEWKRVGFVGREGLRDEYRPNRFLALNDSRSSGLEIWWRGARHYDGLRFLPGYRRDDAAVLEPHHILAESERSAAVYQEPVPDLDPCGLQWTLLACQRSLYLVLSTTWSFIVAFARGGCSSYSSAVGY